MKTECSFVWGCLCFALFLWVTACTASLIPNGPAADSAPSDQKPITATSPVRDATLILAEEFSGAKLNTDYWTTEHRWGRTNEPELQYYSPDAVKVGNGILRITAAKSPMDRMDYVSGMIASYDLFTFTYGYLEMRAKIPSGRGLWPAFWMYLNRENGTGEIDVFEFLGHQPHVIHMAYHFPELKQFWFNGPDYSQDYHTYAVDWQPDHISWYIDSIERARATTAIPNEPMYLIVNLAIGGPWAGAPDQSSHFPAYYDIDYIRVYQQ